LIEDCETAIHQFLHMINTSSDETGRDFIKKVVDLLELKKRLRDAILKGMEQTNDYS